MCYARTFLAIVSVGIDIEEEEGVMRSDNSSSRAGRIEVNVPGGRAVD
jgi:hypothetical protein